MNEELISQIYSVKSSTIGDIKGLLHDIKHHNTHHLESRIRELEGELKKLKKSKRYGLVWEDKPEDVVEQCKKELPLLKEVTSRRITKTDDDLTHILIEGDNFHALSTLAYTHAGKIDVIYIDPPYNTGATDWKYNNNYIDNNDTFRHSKWLSMMNNRLKIAKKLLSEYGFVALTIDHYELFNIGALLDEVFGEQNRVGIVTVYINPKGRQHEKFFSASTEYMLVYAKNANCAEFNNITIDKEKSESFNLEDEKGKYRLDKFMRVRSSTLRKEKPDFFYPIYVSHDLKTISAIKADGYIEVLPIDNNKEYTWKTKKETFNERLLGNNYVALEKNGEVQIYNKFREQQVFKNIWTDKKYFPEFQGTNLLKKILGDNIFNYPKSLYAVLDILKIVSKPSATVLDFFAGSGTTGHAVLELNKEDGGKRQFILCTNNENQIAEEVTYPRIKNVIEGYSDVEGIPANLRYYKTEFVGVEKSLDDLRYKFMGLCDELLCIKENTFEEVKLKGFVASFLPLGENGMRASGENQERGGELKLYQNSQKYTVILYDIHHFDDCIKLLRTLEKPVKVYIFSMAREIYEEEFGYIGNHIEVANIPDDILETYKKIFQF